MKIFFITVKINNNKIVFNTHNLTILQHHGYYSDTDETLRPIITHMLDNFAYIDTKNAEALVNRIADQTRNFFIQHENTKQNASFSSVHYTIPAQQTLSFDILYALYDFLKSRKFDHIIITDEREWPANINTFKPENTTDCMRMGTLALSPDDAMRILTTKILSLNAIPDEYAIVTTELKKVLAYTETIPVQLGECFGSMNRFDIQLHHEKIPSTLTSDNTPNQRVNYLYVLARFLLAQNRGDDLRHFVNSISKTARLNLFIACLGKKAPDGGNYKWEYTEWSVIKDANFYIREDGRMGVKLADNNGYKTHYAPTKRNHHIMQSEFEAIANINQLEFDKDTNFHEELIFTPASTQKLIAANIHINDAYLKKLLLAKNQFSLFRQCRLSSDKQHLPRDIFDIISNTANPEGRSGIIKGDIKAARDIGWNAHYAKLKP